MSFHVVEESWSATVSPSVESRRTPTCFTSTLIRDQVRACARVCTHILEINLLAFSLAHFLLFCSISKRIAIRIPNARYVCRQKENRHPPVHPWRVRAAAGRFLPAIKGPRGDHNKRLVPVRWIIPNLPFRSLPPQVLLQIARDGETGKSVLICPEERFLCTPYAVPTLKLECSSVLLTLDKIATYHYGWNSRFERNYGYRV